MGISKVFFNGETLIDLTKDTVTQTSLAEGATAHNAAGDMIYGALKLFDMSDFKPKDFIINLSGDDGVSFTADKTFSQIYEAYTAGKDMFVILAYTKIPLRFGNGEEFQFVVDQADSVRGIINQVIVDIEQGEEDEAAINARLSEISFNCGFPVTVSEDSTEGYTSDRDFYQITSAFDNGKAVYCVFGDEIYMPTLRSKTECIFEVTAVSDSGVPSRKRITLHKSNGITVDETESDSYYCTSDEVEAKIAEAISGAIGGAY